jgi:hypothetical protein
MVIEQSCRGGPSRPGLPTVRFLFLLSFGAAVGSACSCGSYPYAPVQACEIFHKTEVVFRGRMIDDIMSRQAFGRPELYRFLVEENFKGLPSGVKEVFVAAGSGTDCGAEFVLDKDYVIYTAFVSRPTPPASAIPSSLRSDPGQVGHWQTAVRLANWYTDVPRRWSHLWDAPVFVVDSCNPSRPIQRNDSDLEYLRLASQGKLEKSGWIEGDVVQNGFGSSYPPAPAAVVTATRNGRAYTTHTTENGSYRLKDVPPGEYTLTVTKDGFSPATVVTHNRMVRAPEVPSGGCSAVSAAFQTSATISGIVLTHLGRPAVGVDVALGEIRADGSIREVPDTKSPTGPDGRFRVKNVPVARVLVGVNVNGSPHQSAPFDAVYAPGVATPEGPWIFLVKPDEQVKAVVLRLPAPLPFARLHVKVLWADGTPAIEGVRASATWDGHNSAFESAATRSNRVELPLALGRTYQVSADLFYDRHRPYFYAKGVEQKTVLFTHDGQEVTLRLNRNLER